MITKLTRFCDLDDNAKVELTADLKPCPLCGGEAKAVYGHAGYGFAGVGIRCEKCFVRTFAEMIGCGRLTDTGSVIVTEEEAFNRAVAKWNRRTEQ